MFVQSFWKRMPYSSNEIFRGRTLVSIQTNFSLKREFFGTETFHPKELNFFWDEQFYPKKVQNHPNFFFGTVWISAPKTELSSFFWDEIQNPSLNGTFWGRFFGVPKKSFQKSKIFCSATSVKKLLWSIILWSKKYLNEIKNCMVRTSAKIMTY